jgi:hypothetical protein
MEKKLLKTLILGALLSVSTTAFAANPFELVPTSNWTYDAIGNLVQGGVFEGYRDINFSKNQTFTRYELATFVAKAMANEDKASAEQKASIHKLAEEFKGELTNLGVYTAATAPAIAPAATPKALDNVQVSGQYRIRYQHATGLHKLQGKFELDATTSINDNWKVNASAESYKNFYTDAGYKNGTYSSAWGNGKEGSEYNGAFDVTILNAQGKIAGADVTIGKFNNFIGSGLMFDDKVTGIQVVFGDKLKTKLAYSEADSNISANAPTGSYLAKLHRVVNADFSYELNKATTLAASYQNWTSKTSGVESMKVYELSATSKLSKDFSTYASFDKTSADDNNKAYVIGVSYKGADKNKKGSYGAWIDYENFQWNTSIDTTNWMAAGQKGIALGFDYVPAKNMKWTNVFVHSKTLANDLNQPEGQKDNFYRTQMYFYF